jgi:hypothetical protein
MVDGCLRRRAEEGKREERETTGQTQKIETRQKVLPFRVLLIAVSHIFNFTTIEQPQHAFL